MYVYSTAVCVQSRLRRAKQLQQSAEMLRGAANHRQPILPQLLHSMRAGNFRQVVDSHAVSTQQLSLGSSNFQACFQARLLEQATRGPGKAGLIADSVASTRFHDASPQARRRLHPSPYPVQHATHQATASSVSEDHKSHPNKSTCTAELKLSWSHWSGTSPDRGYFTARPALRACQPARRPALWQP